MRGIEIIPQIAKSDSNDYECKLDDYIANDPEAERDVTFKIRKMRKRPE